jgi:hypothetical protein
MHHEKFSMNELIYFQFMALLIATGIPYTSTGFSWIMTRHFLAINTNISNAGNNGHNLKNILMMRS